MVRELMKCRRVSHCVRRSSSSFLASSVKPVFVFSILALLLFILIFRSNHLTQGLRRLPEPLFHGYDFHPPPLLLPSSRFIHDAAGDQLRKANVYEFRCITSYLLAPRLLQQGTRVIAAPAVVVFVALQSEGKQHQVPTTAG